MSARVILSTAPSLEAGRQLAGILLDRSVVACVNLIPAVESHYVWNGQRQSEAEVLLIIKTMEERVEECLALLREHHSYECPEGVVLDVKGGLSDYLAWLGAAVAEPGITGSADSEAR